MPLIFVLIPYFTERQEAMRVPVVTFATMGLCLLSLAFGRGVVERRATVFIDAVEAAADYARMHPDLDDGELSQMWASLGRPGTGRPSDPIDVEGLLGQLTELFPEQFDAAGGEEQLVGDQATLDALVEEAWEAWGRQPWVRFGLVRGDFRGAALLTHPFLHAGWLHLLGNLLFMWLAMSSLENVWGRGVLAGFYVACGAVAGGVQLLFMGDQPMVPLIGASGAVAGLMGAYLVCFARSRIRIWYFVWVLVFARTGTMAWPAWVALPLWLGYQLFSWLGLGTHEVGYAAHVGGFVFGAAGALAFTRSSLYARFSSVPEADLPGVTKDIEGNRIAPEAVSAKAAPKEPPKATATPTAAPPLPVPARQKATKPTPTPPAADPAPWDDEELSAEPSPAETSDELVANIHDWMASSDAGGERDGAVPAAPVPWTDDDAPRVEAPDADGPPAGPLERGRRRPTTDRFTTDESKAVSAPWGQVSDPGVEPPIEARLRPRTSKLADVELQRLSLVTAEGAPFKVPFEQVIGVFPAHIVGEDPFDVCDLVQGIHRTAGGVLVETVRLPSPLQRSDPPFAAQVRQLMAELAFVRTWPDGHLGEASGFPIFDRLDEYETALLRCIAEEG